MRRLLQLIQSHIRYKIIVPYLALTLLVTMVGATIVLVLVGLECFMAMRFGHYRR